MKDYRMIEFAENPAAQNTGAVEFIKQEVIVMKVASITEKF